MKKKMPAITYRRLRSKHIVWLALIIIILASVLVTGCEGELGESLSSEEMIETLESQGYYVYEAPDDALESIDSSDLIGYLEEDGTLDEYVSEQIPEIDDLELIEELESRGYQVSEQSW